jgi:hypothetical protein
MRNIQLILLVIHIAAGCLTLFLGVAAMAARKLPGAHTRWGTWFHWLFLTNIISAIALTPFDWPRLWWLAPVAIGSYGFALLGYWSAVKRPPRWLILHLTGQGGAMIAMITALLVVNAGLYAWWAWVLPTLVGSPAIAWIIREVRLGRRPKL